MRLIAFFLLFLTLSMSPALSQMLHSEVRLISPVTATGDADAVPLALHITLEKNWHAYWRTPGDAGLPPMMDWSGSENFATAAIKWPVPNRFTTLDLDNFGYHDAVTFPIDVTLKEKGAPLSVKMKLDLLVCSEICVPETHHLTIDLPAGPATASADTALYNEALTKLPKPASDAFRFEKAYLDYDQDNRNYLVVESVIAAAPGTDADLFAEHQASITFGKPDISYDRDLGRATFRSAIHSTLPLDDIKQKLAAAPLTLTYADGGAGFEAEMSLSEVLKPAEPPMTLIERIREFDPKLLAFALFGGLILNLMPCVLPVLSLKILSVVGHGGKDNRRTIFRNFMASALGILASFWLMAGTVVALKAAGETIGWGIQFQHPGFLIFMITLLILFSVNLWGFFEIPLPRFIARNIKAKHEHEPTLLGHFLTGAFATLLATPCTAPFLGTAVGFALARGAFEIFTIFTCLGIGLALPYILLAVSPRVFKYMPKPGEWMIILKKVMSIALLVTAAWLLSVLITAKTTPTLDAGWQKLDQAAIATAVAEGKTVIVDVTADWCLTCKANKRLVLEQEDVLQMLAAENIVKMQADWTHRDEDIAAYLKSFGKYGIPFNVIYGPGAPEGIVLPELLTKNAVSAGLAEAAGE